MKVQVLKIKDLGFNKIYFFILNEMNFLLVSYVIYLSWLE